MCPQRTLRIYALILTLILLLLFGLCGECGRIMAVFLGYEYLELGLRINVSPILSLRLRLRLSLGIVREHNIPSMSLSDISQTESRLVL